MLKRRVNLLAVALSALVATGCGGSNSGVRIPGQAVGTTPDAATRGVWSDVIDWPLIPIHATLLPDGRVFTFGTDDGSPMGQAVPTGQFRYDIWNPADGTGLPSHLTLPNFTAVDTFCAAQLVLPVRAGEAGAGVVIVGGDTFPRPLEPDPQDPDVPEPFDDGNEFTTILDYSIDPDALRRSDGNALAASLQKSDQNMAAGRWYATTTTLLNGEIYVQGGNSRTRISGELFPEVRDTAGVYRALALNTEALNYYYPRNFVAPNGQIFGYDTEGQMYYVDPSGAGTLTLAGTLDEDFIGDDATVAMFAPGRLLNFAGASPRAAIIDITSGAPVVTETDRLSTHRRLATATLLPNGQVLATGGSPVYNTLAGVSYFAETWDPVSGQWTLGAEGFVPRLYHSVAMLLQDGRVLVGGGGAPGPATNLNAEIYSPPYLFKADGSPAVRPAVNAVPETLTVGRQFAITVTDVNAAPARVALIKTGAVTHGLNMEQRYIDLPFTRSCNGATCRLDLRLPSQAADVPPGYYLLFVLNAKGTPSIGKFVFLGIAAAADPAQDPTITAPGNRNGTAGTPTTLALSATDPNPGTALVYAAAGLPVGLSINTATGRVDGTPAAAGRYDVVVSASDGVRTASSNFVWTIAAAAP